MMNKTNQEIRFVGMERLVNYIGIQKTKLFTVVLFSANIVLVRLKKKTAKKKNWKTDGVSRKIG